MSAIIALCANIARNPDRVDVDERDSDDLLALVVAARNEYDGLVARRDAELRDALDSQLEKSVERLRAVAEMVPHVEASRVVQLSIKGVG